MKKNIIASLGALALLAAFAAAARAVNIIPLKPDSGYDAPCTVFGYPSRGISCGKTTAPSGKMDIVGDVNITGSLVTGGATSGSDPLSVSSAIIGVLPTVSTITATGVAQLRSAVIAGAATVGTTLGVTGNTALTANLYIAPNTTVTSTVTASNGNLDVGGALSAITTITGGTGLIVTAGPIKPYKRSRTQILAITPAVGDLYECSDCSPAYSVLVGTGTGPGAFGMMAWTQY